MSEHANGPPRTLRFAAYLLLAYGITVLGQAIVGQVLTGWTDVPGFLRAAVRAAAFTAFTWGLLRAQRWAWWFAVVASGFLLCSLLISLVILGTASSLGVDTGVDVSARLYVFVGAMALELGAALGLLATASARDAVFRVEPTV